MIFRYLNNVTSTDYEFDILYDLDGTPHVGAKSLCNVLELEPKYQTTKHKTTLLSLSVGSRLMGCWTLDTVDVLLNGLRLDSVKNKDRVTHFKNHFLASIKHQLNPQAEATSIIDLDLSAAGDVGVNAYRRDMASMGLPPSYIASLLAKGMDEVSIETVSTITIPDMGPWSNPNAPKSVTKKELATFNFRTYQAGHLPRLFKRNNMQSLVNFKREKPEHALSKPEMVESYELVGYKGLNKKGEATWENVVQLPDKPVTNDWDNEPVFTGRRA